MSYTIAMRVLVVGGSDDYVGAPYLAAVAALRSGSESVIVMAPEKVAWAINCLSPDIMTRKLSGSHLAHRHLAAIHKLLQTADILLLGNGTGVHPESASLMRELMKWDGLKVIDADAIKALRGNDIKHSIITPNEREWKLLDKNSDVEKLLVHNVIVKKGMRTSILGRSKNYALTPNRGLTKAGSGDVLAGLCAGYLAQGMHLFSAAQNACKTGTLVADVLTKKKKGYYFLASDLVEEIQKAPKK